MNTILITGMTGFVGANLEAYLAGDFQTKGVSRSSQGEQFISYEDLTVDQLNQAEAIVHLAGKAHDLKNVSEEDAYKKGNTELTQQLFDFFLKSSCKTFIYMSSVKAAADQVEGVLTEEHKPQPQTVYGKSKLAAEEYILSQTLKVGQKVYILRPCMIHGPKNKGNLNLLYSLIRKGVPYPLGSYQNKRSFLSVENLCFVIKELLKGNATSGVYQVSDDQPLSTNELVEIIGEGIGKKARLWSVPKFFIKTLAKMCDVFSLPLTTERLQKLTENYVVSNEKIRKEIQKELPLTSKQGLIQTIQSFQND